VWLSAALVFVVAMVLASPFWAPAVAPLLPWGEATNAGAPPVTPPADHEILARLDRIAPAQGVPAAEVMPAIERLDKRLSALEAKPAPLPPDLGDVRRQLAEISSDIAALTGRIGSLERSARAEPTGDPIDAALTLTLLQMHAAMAVARPFPAEYQVFAGLARNRPDLGKAAEALAEPARTGVASHAVLARRLHGLAGQIAGAAPPPAEDDWGGQILARLRSLVTVRRVAGPGQTAPEAAVSAAEQAMAQGDLAAAIAALEDLRGAPAEAARPWLRMARTRLEAEVALRHVEDILAARLGAAAARPADQSR
jgi:hypothetical protein